MLVYDGLRDWIYENYGMVKNFCESKSLSEGTLSLAISGRGGIKTETLNEICKATGLEIEQIVRWVPDSTKRISDIYRDKEPCYDKLEKVLKEKGITKKKLSLITGIALGTICRSFNTQEKKGIILSYDTLKKIADVLEVSPLDLFEPKDDSIEQREADKKKIADRELSEELKKVIASSGKSLNQISADSGVQYCGLYNAVKKDGKLTKENINKLKLYFGWKE